MCVFASDNNEHMPITGDEETKFTTQNLTNLTKYKWWHNG